MKKYAPKVLLDCLPMQDISTRLSFGSLKEYDIAAFKTLIPLDATLISATNASKTVLAIYAKSSTTCNSSIRLDCGVKGE